MGNVCMIGWTRLRVTDSVSSALGEAMTPGAPRPMAAYAAAAARCCSLCCCTIVPMSSALNTTSSSHITESSAGAPPVELT